MKRTMYLAAALMIALGISGCAAEETNVPAGNTTEAVAAAAETGATETQEPEETTDKEEETTAKEAEEETTEETTEEEAAAAETAEETTAETAAEETKAAVEETTAAVKAEISHSGYLFQAGGVVMGMKEDVAPALDGLGDYINYAETKSCAFQGLDKIYSYAGFDIYTYPIENKDYINSIYFTDASVSTPEGIAIGSTVEEMAAAYGDSYTEEFGVYTYTKDESTLSFIVTDGIIEAIEYTAIIEE